MVAFIRSDLKNLYTHFSEPRLDPWWNPAAESQAIDRAHRIGQKNSVIAYRLIAQDTVEEKIVKLQEAKRELAAAIFSADASMLKGLTASDVEMLLS